MDTDVRDCDGVAIEVVLKERTLPADGGIRSEVTATMIVPVGKIPWTGKLSRKAATVFHVEQKRQKTKSRKHEQSPSNRSERTVASDVLEMLA